MPAAGPIAMLLVAAISLSACSATDDRAQDDAATSATVDGPTPAGPSTSTGYTIPEIVDRDFDAFLDAEPGFESFCALFTDIANPGNHPDRPVFVTGNGSSYDPGELDPLLEWRIEDEHRRAREARAFGDAAIALAPDEIRGSVEEWAALSERRAAAFASAWEAWMRTGEGDIPRRLEVLPPSDDERHGDLAASLHGLCRDLF